MWAAATVRRDDTRRSIPTQQDIPSSPRWSRASAGRGATWTKLKCRRRPPPFRSCVKNLFSSNGQITTWAARLGRIRDREINGGVFDRQLHARGRGGLLERGVEHGNRIAAHV